MVSERFGSVVEVVGLVDPLLDIVTCAALLFMTDISIILLFFPTAALEHKGLAVEIV